MTSPSVVLGALETLLSGHMLLSVTGQQGTSTPSDATRIWFQRCKKLCKVESPPSAACRRLSAACHSAPAAIAFDLSSSSTSCTSSLWLKPYSVSVEMKAAAKPSLC